MPVNLLPLAVLAALGAGGAAFAFSQHGAPPTAPAGQFAPLVPGKWYRVLCAVGPAAQAVTAPTADAQATAVKLGLEAQGFFPQAVTPASSGQFTALGHFMGSITKFASTLALTVLGVQEVAAPPQAQQAAVVPPNLDANIPLATAQAVQIALTSEDDPAKLVEFADTLLPDYPAAAALLKTKAALRKAAAPAVAQAAVTSGSFLCELYTVPTYGPPADTGKEGVERIGGETTFVPGDTLRSKQGNVTVRVLPNRVVLLDSRPGKGNIILWSTPTDLHIGTFKFQGDGNLVIYDPSGKALWASNTDRLPGAYLMVQDDGNMVIYRDNDPKWATDTYQFKPGRGRKLDGGGGFFGDLAKSVEHMASDVGASIDHAVKDVEKEIAKVPILKDVVVALEKADPITNMFVRIAKGERVDRAFMNGFDDAGKAAKTLAPYVETVVSVFPGIGPEVSSAIALGCALAEGKSMTDAAIDAACALLPGGPLVQMAARAAVSMGSALISGKKLDQAALGAIRSAMPSQGLRAGFDVVKSLADGKKLDVAALQAIRENLPGGPLVGAAFDGAVALGQGKSLQDAGFATVRGLLPGNTAKQALDFAEKAVKAAEHKVPIEKFLVEELKGDLMKVGMNFVGDQALHMVAGSTFLTGCKDAFDAVHKSVGELVKTPALGQLTSIALGAKLGIAEPVARAALSCVSVPPLASTANKAAANVVNAVTSAMVVVKTARLEQFARPSGTIVATASIKFAVQRGVAGVKADAAALAKSAHPLDGKAQTKAVDLQNAAKLLRRAQLIAYYFAVKARVSLQASVVLHA